MNYEGFQTRDYPDTGNRRGAGLRHVELRGHSQEVLPPLESVVYTAPQQQ